MPEMQQSVWSALCHSATVLFLSAYSYIDSDIILCLKMKIKSSMQSKWCGNVKRAHFPDHRVVMLTMFRYHARVPACPRVGSSHHPMLRHSDVSLEFGEMSRHLHTLSYQGTMNTTFTSAAAPRPFIDYFFCIYILLEQRR